MLKRKGKKKHFMPVSEMGENKLLWILEFVNIDIDKVKTQLYMLHRQMEDMKQLLHHKCFAETRFIFL